MSCFMNHTGIMKDNKLNENNLSAYLKIALKNNADMIAPIEMSFKTCATKQAELFEKFKSKMEKIKQKLPANPQQDRMMRPPLCSLHEIHLMACVNTDTFMNCPSSKWSDTQECNNLRDYMKKCKPKMEEEFKSSEEAK